MKPTFAASPKSSSDPTAPLRVPNRPFVQPRRELSVPTSVSSGSPGPFEHDALERRGAASESASASAARAAQPSPPFDLESPQPSPPRAPASRSPMRNDFEPTSVNQQQLPPLVPNRTQGNTPSMGQQEQTVRQPINWGGHLVQLRADMDETRGAVQNLASQFYSMREFFRTMMEKNYRLNSEVQELARQHNSRKDEGNQFQDTLQQLLAKQAQWTEENTGAQTHVEHLINKVTELELDHQDHQQTLLNIQHEIEQVKAHNIELTSCYTQATWDHFDALGPLPDGFRRIETLNGPMALHHTSCLKLSLYVPTLRYVHETSGQNPRLCVDITKELLGNIASWKNGMYIGEDVIGHGALYSMYRYALMHGKEEMRESVEQELHRSALASGHRILDHYERHHIAARHWEKLVYAQTQVVRDIGHDEGREGSIVRANLGRCPSPMAGSGPLHGDGDKMPDWRADIAMAHQALAVYCRSFHIACSANPQLTIALNTKEMTLSWTCKLLG